MAAVRSTTSALNTVFRFASPYLAPTTTRSCPRCFRPFSSAQSLRQSSKRQLQTATAYRPSTLESELPPPRNANPSSPVGGLSYQETKATSRTDGKTQSIQSQSPAAASTQSTQSHSPAAASTQSVATSSTDVKPRRSRFRPRKAAMVLTPKAVEQLRGLLDQPEPKLIRVGVKNRGCSGLAYHLEFVDKPAAFDETVEQDGVKVLIDSKALFSIIGSEMDWVEDKLNQRFVFKNPNISKSRERRRYGS